MNRQFKRLIRHSFPSLYGSTVAWRQMRTLHGWTPDDERKRRFYGRLIRSNDLVFDVGANLGNRSKVFLQLGARVVAFEPQSYCARILERGLSANRSFRLVRAALGDRPGSAELRVGAEHVLATMSQSWIDATTKSGRFTREAWEGVETVTVTTLDAAILEFGKPHFMKVDVEGFERQVFAGLSQSLESGSFEFAVESLSAGVWCLEKLASLGDYRFQFSSGETLCFDWPDWLPLGQARDGLAAIARANSQGWGDVYFRICQE